VRQGRAAAGLRAIGGWIPTPPTGAPTAAGYLVIRNDGEKPDRLLTVSSRLAGVGLHRSATANGVTTMEAVRGGIVVPPHGTVRLEPKGYHLMFMGLKRPLRAGDRVTLDLGFERAGGLRTTLLVRDR
jgi:copper(I)-binding protein